MEKELLRKLGEETLYSAKGHFKACDLRRQLVTFTIWSCALLNVLSLVGFFPFIDRIVTALGLFGNIALLMWNEGDGKNYRSKHKEAGERYLALHKEIRECFFLDNCEDKEVKKLSAAVRELDQSEKPEIPGYARKLAKKAIENSDPETDNWFLK